MGRTVYSEPSLKLGAALAEIRREKGVLQEELATRLGKDQSLISNVERGHRRIDVLELSTAEQKSAIRRRKTRPSCYMPGGVA